MKPIQLLILTFPTIAFCDEYSELRHQIKELKNLTEAPVVIDAKGFNSSENMKAVYFDTLDFNGKPTKAFAWIGTPEKVAKDVPGIVLVHGGGGTANKSWVKRWTDQGFAAIAFGNEGQTDQRGPDNKWKKHQWAGAWRRGHYKDSNSPIKNQWMYHSVANTILANSLLRSLPGVNPNKVGVMGVSWGGVITSTTIGVDSRFAFAIPTYGCGNMHLPNNHWGEALAHNDLYKNVWNPIHWVKNAKLPVLWFSWENDKHFPLNSLADTYHATPAPYMISLVPKMKHSIPASWTPPDSYAFAKSVVSDNKPWAKQVSKTQSGDLLTVTFSSSKPLSSPKLYFTIEDGYMGSRKWQSVSAKLTQKEELWIATAKIPKEANAYYINVNSKNLTLSSELSIK